MAFCLGGAVWAGNSMENSGADPLSRVEVELLMGYIELTELHPAHSRKHFEKQIQSLHKNIEDLKAKTGNDERWKNHRIVLDLCLDEIDRIGEGPFSLANLQLMRDTIILIDSLADSINTDTSAQPKLTSAR